MSLTGTSGFDERRQLLAAARTELHDGRKTRRARQDRPAVFVKQPHFRAGDAIPRKPADGVEERRAQVVVEVARRKLARMERQVVVDVARELLDGYGMFDDTRDHLAHRNVA